MVPVELGAVSFRRDDNSPEVNEVNHRLYLDMIEGTRPRARLRLTYQQRVAIHYNTKVRARPLQVGDLVLQCTIPNMKIQNHKVFGAN